MRILAVLSLSHACTLTIYRVCNLLPHSYNIFHDIYIYIRNIIIPLAKLIPLLKAQMIKGKMS